MKDKELFDIFDDADNDSIERLIDKCPELSDEQLDKIFVMSETKFKKNKNKTEEPKRDNTIKMTENDDVEGVDVVKKPAWFGILSTAASIILIAGIAIGSTIMIRGNKKIINDDSKIPPAITVTTTAVTGTTSVSVSNYVSVVTSIANVTDLTNNANDTTFSEQPDSETTTETKSETQTEATAKVTDESDFIAQYVGNWRYQTSPTNQVHIDGVDAGIVEIKNDATFKYTDNYGNVKTGTITKYTEKIGGTIIFGLKFSGNSFIGNVAYCSNTNSDELHFGNGDAARLVRGDENQTLTEIAMEKIGKFQEIDGILSGTLGHYDNILFTDNNTRYYKVTDNPSIFTLAELKERINNNFTGEVKESLMKECDTRFKEKDGALYESVIIREVNSINTNGGVVVSEYNDEYFTAKTNEESFTEGKGRTTVEFKLENGEWKIISYSYENK